MKRTLLSLVTAALIVGVLSPARAADLEAALADYRLLPVILDRIVVEWVRLRTQTVTLGTANDRESFEHSRTPVWDPPGSP